MKEKKIPSATNRSERSQIKKKTEFEEGKTETKETPKKPAGFSQVRPTVSPHRGKLKIFFGYAAGTGKTWAMLEAGQAAQKKGIDVVIGYLEPHERPDTLAMAKGLETIPATVQVQKGCLQKEMDLDAILKRRPQLVLVDELAHTNGPNSRHRKRFQDVSELLMQGMDVYSTVNVQHLESLNDLVASITGILVSERFPDDVFDLADQVELVDIEPQELLERLREGKIYKKEQARLASQNFFTADNLAALREIALRRCADRLNRTAPGSRAREHVLVGLSSSPSNPCIIRSAARMAQAFDARFSALYIQTPSWEEMEKEDRARLEENIRLANRLGAAIETAYGEDIAEQIGTYARVSRVTKIVLGRQGRKSAFSSRHPLAEKLALSAPNAEIFIIPDPDALQDRESSRSAASGKSPRRLFSPDVHAKVFPRPNPSSHTESSAWKQTAGKDVGKNVAVLGAAVGLAFFLARHGLSEANLLVLFVFAGFVCSLQARTMTQALIWALASSLLFIFLFAQPALVMAARDPGYWLTLSLVTLMDLLIARLSIRRRRESAACARAAARTAQLYEASQSLQELDEDESICTYITQETSRILGKNTVFYPNVNGTLGKPFCAFASQKADSSLLLESRERAVALWSLKNNKRAGASTDTLGAAAGLYLAVRHRSRIYGVLGIELHDERLSVEKNAMILSLLGQCGLALENNAIAREKEKTALAAHQEKMKTSLLRSISHDLRTPLTTISASADLLLHKSEACTPQKKKELQTIVYEESIWLKDTVENLLALTRLEEEDVSLQRELVDMEEVIEEALRHTASRQNGHPLSIDIEEMCFGWLDGKLIVQMLVNLLNNSFQHTPQSTPVQILCRIEKESRKEDRALSEGSTKKEEGEEKAELQTTGDGQIVVLEVADHGPGIDAGKQARLFDPFLPGRSAAADSSRSSGLGLSLVKTIVDLHGGTIEFQDNHPGTRFIIRLPGGHKEGMEG